MPVRHVTLTPDVVATVSAGTGDWDKVAVFHKGAVTAAVIASVLDVDPVADADDTYYIPSGVRRVFVNPGIETSEVRLKSTDAATVEVEFL